MTNRGSDKRLNAKETEKTRHGSRLIIAVDLDEVLADTVTKRLLFADATGAVVSLADELAIFLSRRGLGVINLIF